VKGRGKGEEGRGKEKGEERERKEKEREERETKGCPPIVGNESTSLQTAKRIDVLLEVETLGGTKTFYSVVSRYSYGKEEESGQIFSPLYNVQCRNTAVLTNLHSPDGGTFDAAVHFLLYLCYQRLVGKQIFYIKYCVRQ